MANEILKLFIEKGFLLDNDMVNFLGELKDENVANEIIDKIAVVSKQKLITKNLVNENIEKIKPILFELEKEKKKLVEKYFVNVSVSVEVKKEMSIELEKNKEMEEGKVNNSVKILSSPIRASQKLEVKDFVKNFRNRYNFMKDILQKKKELEGLTSIDKITGNVRNFSIIGIVTDKRITKNKNLILDVEDLTGKIKVLINYDKEEIFEKSKEILLDDIIGFNVSGTREILFCNDLFYPDCFLEKKSKIDEEIYALFISDMHIGSGNFLEKNFNKFIDWLNGVGCDNKQKQTIKKIRYLFVTGDSVDGVGVYPGQEKDLKIKDMKKQYEKLAEFYKKMPQHISIIQCAGQHDAVRVAAPQPPINEDFAKPLTEIENLYLVSNPSLVEIAGKEDHQGIRVLMYHGAGVIPFVINEIEELRLSRAQTTPARAMKHLLLRRHLAPSHGGFVYIPDKQSDSLLIKEIPDIFTTGDLHKSDIDKYNGVLIISNSCWQTQTVFEEKVGNDPDLCKVPVLNLKTGQIKILDFLEEEENKDEINQENNEGGEGGEKND
jgi:DNA polymerase II small subunit